MVSEVLALKIENCELRRQIQQAVLDQVLREQRGLVEQARAEDGAPEGHVYNLTTRQFQGQ
jgi:hypothetical protein